MKSNPKPRTSHASTARRRKDVATGLVLFWVLLTVLALLIFGYAVGSAYMLLR